ncbi:hypothetical protein [Dyadobacter sp. 3J3]|uniref:hypothetical protein n=1 Tax=Dyadobacter sp. 3J3 TaxID=2606600 RepID=UPI0013586A2B|nr:hypothetical protein [Dyadobacter sp. 3J3]
MEITSTRSQSITFKIQNDFLMEKLSVFENQIVELSTVSDRNQKLKDCDLLSLAEKISNIATIRLGLKSRGDKEELVFIQTIEADCAKFPFATQNEILKALEMGIDGHFDEGKDIFFSSSKFVRWIRLYFDSIRKPVMVKFAQQADNAPLSAPEITTAERISTASKVANGYADARRKDPAHRVDLGDVLFRNLESLGVYELAPKVKETIYLNVKKKNKDAPEESVKGICQNTAYNDFIGMLVELEFMLTESGELVNLNQNESN